MTEIVRTLPDAAATQALAREVSLFARAGDTIALGGDLGAGKTTFARAFIRALAGRDDVEVPSPTFTLVQTYDETRVRVVHCDLYRLADPRDLDELGIEEALADSIALVEWPQNAGGLLPGDILRLDLEQAGAGRVARLAANGAWADRLDRIATVAGFLDRSGLTGCARLHLQGDASARRYERLDCGKNSLILMDAPARPDPGLTGAPSYSAIAHLAESVHPFAAMAQALRAAGVHAPAIRAHDLDAGLLVLDDLGAGKIVGDEIPPAPIAERYLDAARLLAHLHGQHLDQTVTFAGLVTHTIPPFNRDVFDAEAALLLEWFVPHLRGSACGEAARGDFRAAWNSVLAASGTLERAPTWVLRDYHSPNIIWCEPPSPAVGPHDRIGVIDFQDALWGPAAYDVASLGQDARVDVPESLERKILSAYLGERTVPGGFDEHTFRADYAVMGAQRNSKILGIFARLARRDGKAGYLRHIPRVRGYLVRCLAHPALGPVRAWYERHLPEAIGGKDAKDA